MGVTFSGIIFEHATWLRPMKGEGFVDQQAGACDQCEYGVPVPSEGCGMNDDCTYYYCAPSSSLDPLTDVRSFACVLDGWRRRHNAR